MISHTQPASYPFKRLYVAAEKLCTIFMGGLIRFLLRWFTTVSLMTDETKTCITTSRSKSGNYFVFRWRRVSLDIVEETTVHGKTCPSTWTHDFEHTSKYSFYSLWFDPGRSTTRGELGTFTLRISFIIWILITVNALITNQVFTSYAIKPPK